MNVPLNSFEQDYAKRFHCFEVQYGFNQEQIRIPYDHNAQALATAEHVSSLRTQLKSEICSDTQGIDIDAIDDFFDMLQLPRKDFIIVNQDTLATYNQITAQYGWPAYPDNTEGRFYYGTCPPSTDLAVVLRDKESESIHGVAFTEGHLVHELAHETSDWNEWTIVRTPQGRTLTPRRLGQTVFNLDANSEIPRRGEYLEEAFAATIQAHFLKRQGKEHGYKNYADIAAEGLAYLCAQDPDLFPSMIEARQTVAGLRRVAQSINRIHPRLYSQLQKIAYTEAGFAQATHDIKELVG